MASLWSHLPVTAPPTMSVGVAAVVLVGVAAVLMAVVRLVRFVHLDEYFAVVVVGGLFRRNSPKTLRPWSPDLNPPTEDDPVLAYYTWDMFRPVVMLATVKSMLAYSREQMNNARDFSALGIAWDTTMGKSLGAVFTRALWKPYRTAFIDEFTVARVKAYTPKLREVVLRWRSAVRKTQGVATMPQLERLVADMLAQYLFGDVSEERLDFLIGLVRRNNLIYEAMNSPMTRLLSYVWPLHPLRARLAHHQNEWRAFITETYRENLRNGASTVLTRTMEKLATADKAAGGAPADVPDEIFHTFYELFIFNIDISSQSLMWLLVNTARHACVAKNVRPVLAQMGPTSTWSGEDWRTFKMSGAMEGVAIESTRMCPALDNTFPEQLTRRLNLDGLDVPARTFVAIQARMVNNTGHEWQEPGKFDPDRDFTNKSVHMFGFGERACLGRPLAEMMKAAFLAITLETSDVVVADKGATAILGLPYLARRDVPHVQLRDRA